MRLSEYRVSDLLQTASVAAMMYRAGFSKCHLPIISANKSAPAREIKLPLLLVCTFE